MPQHHPAERNKKKNSSFLGKTYIKPPLWDKKCNQKQMKTLSCGEWKNEQKQEKLAGVVFFLKNWLLWKIPDLYKSKEKVMYKSIYPSPGFSHDQLWFPVASAHSATTINHNYLFWSKPLASYNFILNNLSTDLKKFLTYLKRRERSLLSVGLLP